MSRMAFEIMALGPLAVVGPDGPTSIRGPRARAVLAALALQANRSRSVAELVEAVWDEDPPATAREQVRICVSDLRRILRESGTRARIETRAPGYLLVIDEQNLDLAEFGRLVQEAVTHATLDDTHTAVASLRAAEELWRGPALSDVPGRAAATAAAGLEQARLDATEERVRLELDLGGHRRVLGELRELTRRWPFREGVSRWLMLALYRCGRTAEALEVYRQARMTLIGELGVEPGPELQELHRAILQRSPSLDFPSAAPGPQPHQLPAAIADFTGREPQLRALRECLTRTRDEASYGVRIAALAGPGGVGKTTLAVRAAHELASEFPDGQLYAHVRNAGDDPVMTTLDRFLRALAVAGMGVPRDREERIDLYRSRLAGRRMLVVLDAVTDESDVVPLLPSDPGCGVIVTSRPRLSGLQGADLIEVTTLDEESSLRVLERLVGDRVAIEPGASRRLAELCGGLPLALRISAARLSAHPHWPVAHLVGRLEDESGRLDELEHSGLQLRSTLELGYHSVDEEARRLFRLLALVQAPDSPGWTSAALLDRDPRLATDALDRLTNAQLVMATHYDARGARYRLHDLVRVYAAHALAMTDPPLQQEAAVRRLLGGWLALAEAAHRAEHDGDYSVIHGDADRWQPEAGRLSVSLAWLDQERASLVAAVHHAAAAGLDELCWDLALTLVTLFDQKGYLEDWRATSQAALAASERAGNRLGQAAMYYSLGSHRYNWDTESDRASELLGTALEGFRALGHQHGMGLALRNLSVAERLRGNLVASRSYGNEALGYLRSSADPIAEASTLRSLALTEGQLGAAPAAHRLANRALDLFQQAGYRRGIAQALLTLAAAQLEAGNPATARTTQLEVLDLLRELDDPVGVAFALTVLGRIESRNGRTKQAAVILKDAVERATSTGHTVLARRAREELSAIHGQ